MQVHCRSAFNQLRCAAFAGLFGLVFFTVLPAAAAEEELAEGDVDELSEVVVEGKVGAPPAAEIKRESVAVTDAVTVQDIAKTGDSDVGASLKRVAGVSVQGGRFAVVRGLAARYISNTFNDDLMASTNPYRRDVELDLFPSSILSGIQIQKSFTADMPGDTTGGVIRIGTRDPEARFNGGVSVKVGGARGATGKDLLTYKGGDTDWLGFDDGTRGLPGIINQITNGGLSNPTSADSMTYGGELPNIYNLRRSKAGPDYGISGALGNGFLRDNGFFSLYGTVSYDRGADSRKEGTRADLSTVTQTTFSRDSFSTDLNGYFVAGYESDAGWKILSRTTLLRQTEDSAEYESGLDVDDNTPFSETLLEFNERQFLSEQLQADIRLRDTDELALRAGFTRTASQTPDRRSYRYQTDRFVSTSLERMYADLEEDAISLGADYSLPIDWSGGRRTKVKGGALYDTHDRSNDLVRLGIAPVTVTTTDDLETLLTPENFANGTYRLRARSTNTDSYRADQETLAAYVTTDTAITESLSAIVGVRFESYETKLRFPNSSATPEASLSSEDLLPSFGVNWRPTDDWQLRAAVSRTVARPTISELAPSVFFDDRGRRFTGCTIQTVGGLQPCKISTIDNFDLRAEYYFSRADSVSLALFHKEIDDPLERGVLDGGISGYTYRNSDSAKLSGVELDGQIGWFVGAGHGITVGANVSYIHSSIKLDEVGERIEGITSRKLQGQSPWLVNSRVTYEHQPTRQTATISYNYYSDRIDVAGGNGLQAAYEKGRNTVNFTYEKQFMSGFKVGVKLLNLTDDDSVYVQRDTADTETVIERWKTGRGGEISFGYQF